MFFVGNFVHMRFFLVFSILFIPFAHVSFVWLFCFHFIFVFYNPFHSVSAVQKCVVSQVPGQHISGHIPKDKWLSMSPKPSVASNFLARGGLLEGQSLSTKYFHCHDGKCLGILEFDSSIVEYCMKLSSFSITVLFFPLCLCPLTF